MFNFVIVEECTFFEKKNEMENGNGFLYILYTIYAYMCFVCIYYIFSEWDSFGGYQCLFCFLNINQGMIIKDPSDDFFY